MMNLAIDQSNLYLLIPSKMGWLTNMLSNDEDISVVDAIKKLYSSEMYKKLENESSKTWHLDLLLFMKILWKNIDFKQELLSMGSNVEVLTPLKLRE